MEEMGSESAQTTNGVMFSELHGQNQPFFWLLLNSENHANKYWALFGYISVNTASLMLFVLICFHPKIKFVLDGFP